jgi:DNA-binding beta-propeller fold protein YncE
MRHFLHLMFSLALAGSASALDFVSEFRMPGGSAEILTHDPATGLVFSTRDTSMFKGVIAIGLEDPYHPKIAGQTDLRKSHPKGVASISSIAACPLGRGILAVSLVPKHPTEFRGAVALIDTRTRQVVHVAEVGWHPDCVNFSKDGRYLLVANEGEYTKHKTNTPGSLGVADFSSIKNVADLTRVNFSDYPLGPRQMVAGVRAPYESDPSRKHLDMEPEYVTSDGKLAYLSLQENNALAIFDLKGRYWKKIMPFGAWPVRMDASDRDGPWGRRQIKVTDEIVAMPMPDTIATITAGGRTVVLTANEGEGDNISRVKHLGTSSPALCPDYRASLKAIYGIDPQQDAALGRLQVSVVDGLNADGRIEKLHACGTRSFSIWDPASGRRLYDSGSFFEDHAAQSDRKSFNHNRGDLSRWDTRSDNRGPETEAVAAGMVRGVPMAFVANERQNGLYAFSISNPASPKLKGYYSGGRNRHSNPECILFLPKNATPLGSDIIVTAWEATSSITIHKVNP